jgi:hypothetical protein
MLLSPAAKATIKHEVTFVIVSACDTERHSPKVNGFIHFWLVSEMQLVATQGPHDLQASRSVHAVALSVESAPAATLATTPRRPSSGTSAGYVQGRDAFELHPVFGRLPFSV